MITEALQHCSGIGPVRLAQLHAAGLRTWADILDSPAAGEYRWHTHLVEEVRQCAAALAADDVAYFVKRLAPPDKWRILAHYYEETTFFDIETTGLEFDAMITVIACWHRGQVRTFLEHENLDEFLELLDEVKLLASFNGSSFDVPRVLDAFHLPELPCPHLDLRWIGYHQGYTSGLKEMAAAMGIERPADLRFVNGQDAICLWELWRRGNVKARSQLIRYCAADVLMLAAVAERLAGRTAMPNLDSLWQCLPEVTDQAPSAATATPTATTDRLPVRPTGAFLSKLRGMRSPGAR